MPDGVAILGGFRGDESSAEQRDPEQFESVISGDLLGNDLDVPVTGSVFVSGQTAALVDSLVDNTGTLLFVDRTGLGTVVDGLVFEGAYTPGGRQVAPTFRNGVFVLGAVVDFRNCVFRDNNSKLSGPLYVSECFNQSGVSLDPAFAASHPCGQAAVSIPSVVVIENCAFLNNHTTLEGADTVVSASCVISGSVALIEDSRFEFDRVLDQVDLEPRNRVSQSGLLLGSASDVVVRDTEFRRCAGVNGGFWPSAIGVGVSSSPSEQLSNLSVERCTFEGNLTYGLGVVTGWYGSVSIDRSLFLGNRRYDTEPGNESIAVGTIRRAFPSAPSSSVLRVSNSLFVGNGSFDDEGLPQDAPVIFSAGPFTDLYNLTFVDNTANDDPILLFNPDNQTARVVKNLIDGVSPGMDPLFVGRPDGGGDGFGDDPITPDTDESLNDDYGNLRLRPASPAIDAASDASPITFLDLDGNIRVVDDPTVPNAADDPRNRVDLGAYEFQGESCLPDVNRDGILSGGDFNAWITVYNAGGSLADQNRDGAITPSDFNAWILNYNTGCP